MSMSNLGQQLAAINAGGKNTGSTLATSTRHEDAVGRGLAHSVQVGHALHNKSHRYKASIIHEDARKASDVPLATIRENCVESLRHLETIDPSFGPFVGSLCSPDAKERGLMMSSENDKLDKRIEDLLFRTCVVMGLSSSNTNNNLVSGLNVIEYLLRKYDIHIRPKTASTMLLAMLPHHEEPYFLRVLQLIDLANLPEWSFLRPYAVPGARLGRSVLGQQASKDVTLIRYLGRLSQRNSLLPNAQQSLSFTAAVIVEALTLQTQRKGSMEEKTCQALLPFIVMACKNEHYCKKVMENKINPEEASGHFWQSWGYILASTLVEAGVLAPEPRTVLVTAILQGLALQQEAIQNYGRKSAVWKDAPTYLSNGLIVALTILAQDPTMDDAAKSDSLPLITGNSTRACGFSVMDKEIFHALLTLDEVFNTIDPSEDQRTSKLVDCMANLYRKDGVVEIEQWIASLLAVGWKRIVKSRVQSTDQPDKKRVKARVHSRKILHLIINLAKHPQLETLWTQANGQWVESFTSYIFQNTPVSLFEASEKEDGTSEVGEEVSMREIIEKMRNVHGVAYERGITNALIRTKNKEDRVTLAKYLGLTKSKDSMETNDNQSICDAEMSSISLPPRVALEHADRRIRLESIPQLVKEAKDSMDEMDIDDNKGGSQEGESICQALLRRFLMDDDMEVALMAAKGLDELHQSGGLMHPIELGEGALEGLYKWSQTIDDDSQRKEQLVVYSCRFAARAAQIMRSSNQSGSAFPSLIEALGSLMASTNDTVSSEAAKGIVLAYGKNKDCKNDFAATKIARMLIASDDRMLRSFQRSFRERNTCEHHIRRQLSRVMLKAIESVSPSSSMSNEALRYCIWVVETFSHDFSKEEIGSLGKTLKSLTNTLAKDTKNIHTTFGRLASCNGQLFRNAVSPFIQSVCENIKDNGDGDVAPIAVVMEVVLSLDTFVQIRNLLGVARGMASNDATGNFYAIGPAIALCCHREERVRALAVSFLSHLGTTLSESSKTDEWMCLTKVCLYFEKNNSSIVLKGASFLPEALAKVLSESKNAELIRKYFLQALLCSATADAAADSVLSSDYVAESWLGGGYPIGGYRVASTLLEVAENAGNTAFPILSRWTYVGEPLLSVFLANTSDVEEISHSQSQLIQSVVKLLRGVTNLSPSTDNLSSTTTIITTGPSSQGRRARSYSFGKNDAVITMKPYPADMQSAIVSILMDKNNSAVHDQIRACLFDVVLCSDTWKDKVFSKLNGKSRQKIASALLSAATESYFHSIDSVLVSLLLDANDVTKLMDDQDNDETGLSKQTYLSDFISVNHSRLVTNSGMNELLRSIFDKLKSFLRAQEDEESLEFAGQALLGALLELVKSMLAIDGKVIEFGRKRKTLDSWLSVLVEIVLEKRSFFPLRSKRTVFYIFTALCKKFPRTTVGKMTPIITGVVSDDLTAGEETILRDCYDTVIPVYFKYSSAADLSPFDLFKSFINRVSICVEQMRPKFYMFFIQSLSRIAADDHSTGGPVGSFVSVVLAKELYSVYGGMASSAVFSKLSELATLILSSASSVSRIEAVWTMQHYAREILFNLLQEEASSIPDSILSVSQLTKMTMELPSSVNETKDSPSVDVLRSLCSLFLMVTCDVATADESRNIIKKTEWSDSTIVLKLWQDLLLIQSACHNRLGGSGDHTETNFLERLVEITGHALDGIQNSLPSHIFLAFITNLVTEGETEDLRARAVQLIAERSASSYLGKSEAILYVEMIPSLIQLLQDDKGPFLKQSIFAAIDSIGRNACLLTESIASERHIDIFTSAAFKASSVIEVENQAATNDLFSNMNPESRQLVSSAALCSSTAIKVCGPRALPVLPKLMKPLFAFQRLASRFIKTSSTKNEIVDKKELGQARLMQLSILRTFAAVIQRMPMLLKPYLVEMLESFAEVHGSILLDSTHQSQSIETEIEGVQILMTSLIPSRQLIPAASKSIESIGDPSLNLPALSLMTEAINKSKSSEVSGMINIIIKTATCVFDRGNNRDEDSDAMQTTDALLLSLVMKLSEVQLRSLYRKIREWRGDLDESNPEETASRRCAFWRFSSALSKQLKSIYLSCLTSVYSDAVTELEMAASALSKKDSVRKLDGKKKQRLLKGNETKELGATAVDALKNLLLCLEVSLRSDAHEGGDWIREMESQRYEQLLEPLGKLLHSKLSPGLPQHSFESLIQGDDSQSGSVVECLVALATAAGDEQLWKPLNHSILEACSDENRSEVRKAGVSCLLSLINSIGEEYMVLIPECLPVLSELLEDSDEEISGIAQECISQSEELLGESLQDSLR